MSRVAGRPLVAPLAVPVIAALVALLVALPGRAPGAQALVDSVTVAYELDGLRILHHKTNSQVFSIGLYLLGGSRQITGANAGIEPMYLIASDYGTADYPGEEARRARARTASSIGHAAFRDWTVFAADGLREDFDSTFVLLASRLMRPTLDSTGMTIARNRLLVAARSALNSPEAQAAVLAESLAFAGHPYAVDPDGNEASLRALSADDLRRYATAQFVKTRMLLVVVGDVTKERVDALVGRTLAGLPRGNYVWTLPPPVSASRPGIATGYRRISTNYLFGYMHGPPISSPDYPAFQYAMGVLSSFVSSTIRGAAQLSYAAGVTVYERGTTGAAVYVSTTKPDSVVKLLNRLFDLYEDELRIPAFAMKESADGFRNQYLFGIESADAHADMLARALLYDGDHRAATRRAQVMRQVRDTDLRRMVRTYAKTIQWGFVGDTSIVPREPMAKRK